MKERIENSFTLEEMLSNKKYIVDYYQREYRWGKKQIEQLIDDLTIAFDDSYDRIKPLELGDIDKFDYYYMGTIILAGTKDIKAIIDGQQRLISLTLLSTALNNLHKQYLDQGVGFQDIKSLIYSERLNKLSFNIQVEEWNPCISALFNGEDFNASNSNESIQNLCLRYHDIIDLLDDYFDGDGNKISYFAGWIMYKLLFIKITTLNEEDANKVFVSMNDRGLRLNSSEMLKGYLLSGISDDNKRNEANDVWKKTVLKLKESSENAFDGTFNTEDDTFIATWIRAKYASKIREGKKDAQDQDYELIGREFHQWIRQNHKELGLVKSDDFYNFVVKEFKFYAEIYLRLKQYSNHYTKGFEEVFYNANKDLTYQYMFIISTLNSDDSAEIIDKKIKLVSTYLDSYSARRLFNFKKLNWNTQKNELFNTIKAMRGMSLGKLTVYLTYKLKKMDCKLDGITTSDNGNGFRWNQFTGRYILHILARFTDYVNVETGNVSLFDTYIDRSVKNSYDKEHVIPDKFEDYDKEFTSKEEFNAFRWKLGNLILLKLDKNRSFQDKPYDQKRQYYLQDNILAQAFHDDCYVRNPKFKAFIQQHGYNFKAYPKFGKAEILERQEVYQSMAYDIWSEDKLKSVSNEWDNTYEMEFNKNSLNKVVKINILEEELNDLTNKKPFLFELDGEEYDCSSFVDVLLKVLSFLAQKNHTLLVDLASKNYNNRLCMSKDGNENESLLNFRSGKKIENANVWVETHGSGKDLGKFLKSLAQEFKIQKFILSLK